MRVTEQQEREILQAYRRWLLHAAYDLMPRARRSEVEDLAAEGWVAMWKALSAYDPSRGALPSWLTTAARRRMIDVLKRDLWFGTVGARGHRRERPAVPVYIDPNDETWQLIADAPFDAAAIARHRDEIYAAILTLTPKQRDYVLRRFWLDESPSSLPGVNWTETRTHLAELLEHLRGIAG